MSWSSRSRNPVVVILLSIGVVAACGEPQCPGGYYKKDDTCYRIKKDGSVEAVEGEDGAVGAGEAGTSQDASVDADPEASPPDMADGSAADSGVAGFDAAPPDAAPPFDGGAQSDAAIPEDGTVGCASPPCGGGSDAAAPDAGVVTCASQPCQNGGACTDQPTGFRCSCTAPYMGERCESRICTTMFLRTQDDLEEARSCAEIQGNLTLPSAGFQSINEHDLPYLTKITGNLTMTGLDNNGVDTPRLHELTLAKLHEIGGSLVVTLTGAGSANEIRFPALTRVGGSVSVTVTETRRLALPLLRTVGMHVILTSLRQLCTLDVDMIERVSGALSLAALFNLPSSALEPLRRASLEASTTETTIGCCVLVDRNCNEGFTQQDRDTFCGCSSL